MPLFLAANRKNKNRMAAVPMNRPRNQVRLRRLWGNLALVIFGILCGAIAAETALRAVGYSYPEFYLPDQARGYALRPGMEGWYRKESEVYIRLNSDGLRDREHAKAKPPDTIRIAVIGDSYPEALQVEMEDAFWSVMQRRLQQCRAFGGRKIEVLNFGVSGYGTAQELLTLREKAWNYSPDIVLLAVTTNNDISDNSHALKKSNEIPYFVKNDGQLILDDSFREERVFRLRQSAVNRLARWIRDHLRLVQAINQAHRGFKFWLAARRAHGTAAGANETNTSAALEELGIDNVVYRQPNDQVWSDAWNVTEGLIVEMAAEVRNKGGRFLVVTLSNGIQVYPDRNARENFMKRLGITDLFYPDNRVEALCQRSSIPVIVLAPGLQAYADRNKVLLHGFGRNIGNGHWNSLGHRLAGELVAQQLCDGLLDR